MTRKLAALSVAIAALVLAACAGRGTTVANGGTSALPGMPDIVMTATLPDGKTKTIHEELPSEGLGTVDDTFWSATLGGFTQQTYSQALGFPPGTKITLTNISKDYQHTLDVVAKIKGAPAKFPQNPTLSTMAHGNGILGKGYASGVLDPGKSVTLTLANKGIYLIGCAFHYGEGMRTVLVVKRRATPGPQATPPAQ
ncbi:MAG: hypothetical protein WAK16_01805 [Candidatus Cybelea sp.]